jgi:hypothetical protein
VANERKFYLKTFEKRIRPKWWPSGVGVFFWFLKQEIKQKKDRNKFFNETLTVGPTSL